MSDEEYYEQLCSNSIDGTLTDAEKEKLEAHLAECPSCAALKADLEQMRALFLSETDVPDSLHASIMQGVEREAKLKLVQPEKPVRRLPVFTMVASAAVVVVVVLGGGLGEIFGRVNLRGDASNASAQTEVPIIAREVQAEVEEAAEHTELWQDGATVVVEPQDDSGSAVQPNQPAPGKLAEPKVEQSAEVETEQMPMTNLVPGTNKKILASAVPENTPSVAAAAPRAVGTLRIPESLRGKSVAHCYLASGTADMPDIVGELLLTEDTFSYFLMENSMTAIQDTLKALEDAGYSVSAYEGVGLSIDSKADSWLLIVSKA